jgi:hypothetical protein
MMMTMIDTQPNTTVRTSISRTKINRSNHKSRTVNSCHSSVAPGLDGPSMRRRVSIPLPELLNCVLFTRVSQSLFVPFYPHLFLPCSSSRISYCMHRLIISAVMQQPPTLQSLQRLVITKAPRSIPLHFHLKQHLFATCFQRHFWFMYLFEFI